MPMEPGTSGVGVGGGQLTTFTTSTFTFHKNSFIGTAPYKVKYSEQQRSYSRDDAIMHLQRYCLGYNNVKVFCWTKCFESAY